MLLRAFCRGCCSILKRASSSWSKEFASEDAYQVLGLPRNCTGDAIKRSFQQLAKATHPDLQKDAAATDRFIRILAAYQILSDPHKRTLYDGELVGRTSQGASSPSASGFRHYQTSTRSARGTDTWSSPQYVLYDESDDDTDVVEWLRHYRSRVCRIVRQKELGTRKPGYYQNVDTDFRAALRHIYYGPNLKTLKGFPEAFEADERSNPWAKDILQLVHGRFLFATVCHAWEKQKRLHGEQHGDQKLWDAVDKAAYARIELRFNAEVKAHASRRPLYPGSIRDVAYMVDLISIYLHPEDGSGDASGELLGTIQGLAAADAGMKCIVFDSHGTSTHAILQHKTPGVKHLHWYRLGSEGMHCECRCRRPWLLPSRFWLFKPRCSTHDIGGWYIEAFKPHSRSKTSLHPAMYILAAAYNTLDTEARSRTQRTSLLKVQETALRIWTFLRKRLQR